MLGRTESVSFVCLLVGIGCVCLTERCGACPTLKGSYIFSGFHAGLTERASLLPNSTSVLKGYISLKEGTFALEILVAVLTGEVTLLHSGVYFFSTTVHFMNAPNNTCDANSTMRVAICTDSDCTGKASLEAVRGTCDKEFSMTATGLLILTTRQTVSVRLFYNGSSTLIIGSASTFSGYLLASIE